VGFKSRFNVPLLSKLPAVECIVRARIPTTNGAEMFLHLYHNDLDGAADSARVQFPNVRAADHSVHLGLPRPNAV
jgi:GTP cyclohydrolase II